jgi:hypothetical protein
VLFLSKLEKDNVFFLSAETIYMFSPHACPNRNLKKKK